MYLSLIVCIPSSAIYSILSGRLYDGPWTQFDYLGCCGRLAIYSSFKFSLQLRYSLILCILYTLGLLAGFVNLGSCGSLLIVQILAASSSFVTLYVGALK